MRMPCAFCAERGMAELGASKLPGMLSVANSATPDLSPSCTVCATSTCLSAPATSPPATMPRTVKYPASDDGKTAAWARCPPCRAAALCTRSVTVNWSASSSRKLTLYSPGEPEASATTGADATLEAEASPTTVTANTAASPARAMRLPSASTAVTVSCTLVPTLNTNGASDDSVDRTDGGPTVTSRIPPGTTPPSAFCTGTGAVCPAMVVSMREAARGHLRPGASGVGAGVGGVGHLRQHAGEVARGAGVPEGVQAKELKRHGRHALRRPGVAAAARDHHVPAANRRALHGKRPQAIGAAGDALGDVLRVEHRHRQHVRLRGGRPRRHAVGHVVQPVERRVERDHRGRVERKRRAREVRRRHRDPRRVRGGGLGQQQVENVARLERERGGGARNERRHARPRGVGGERGPGADCPGRHGEDDGGPHRLWRGSRRDRQRVRLRALRLELDGVGAVHVVLDDTVPGEARREGAGVRWGQRRTHVGRALRPATP
eukprot:8246834-Pyramimonas_sp.AAC.1